MYHIVVSNQTKAPPLFKWFPFFHCPVTLWHTWYLSKHYIMHYTAALNQMKRYPLTPVQFIVHSLTLLLPKWSLQKAFLCFVFPNLTKHVPVIAYFPLPYDTAANVNTSVMCCIVVSNQGKHHPLILSLPVPLSAAAHEMLVQALYKLHL